MHIKKIFNQFFSNEFISNVLKISTSTIFSGIFVTISLPIITKIYDASTLGKYQLLISIITSLGVISSLKYEMAIILPKTDAIAKKIYSLCYYVLVCFSLLLFVLLFFMDQYILSQLNANSIVNISWLIPLGVFFFGFFEIIKASLLRKKNFNSFSIAKVYQVISTQILIIVFGSFSPSALSFAIAYISGNAISSFIFIRQSMFRIEANVNDSMANIALKYKKFPLINTLMVFSNTISNELPVFFIIKYHDIEMLGYFMLANRILVIPMNLLGTSIGKVYFQKASQISHGNNLDLYNLYRKTTLQLIKIGFVSFVLIALFSSTLIELVFGNPWMKSSIIIKIMAIGMFFKFITSPISTTFTILNKQEFSFFITLISLLFRFSVMLYFNESLVSMLLALSLSSAIYYAIFHIFIYKLLLTKKG